LLKFKLTVGFGRRNGSCLLWLGRLGDYGLGVESVFVRGERPRTNAGTRGHYAEPALGRF